ncbi:MAG: AmmeMemoRadiSam system protein A, partial [Victivallales bacterium]|nr:AmmeMemoRadiSam system protein A [Victivallales bacterium]
CFVTLHPAAGQLRGCIGNIMPVENLGDNLYSNALNAAFRDPRFPPVGSTAELEQLRIEVSILTPMQTIADLREFELGRHGIVMNLMGRSAVFLPQVAPEQGWDKDTTLDYLAMKAGLPRNAWRAPEASFQVFEAIVFGEE